jgi:hypothetical protein
LFPVAPAGGNMLFVMTNGKNKTKTLRGRNDALAHLKIIMAKQQHADTTNAGVYQAAATALECWC